MPERTADRAPVMALAMIGVTICLLSVAIAAAGAPAGEKFGRGMFALLVVGVPLVAGLYALGTTTSARFGIGLLALSCACALAGLASQDSSLPYTIGRLSGWVALTLVYWLLLSFPDGRLHGRFERGLAVAVVAVVGVLFFAAALIVEEFPQRTPWATCTLDCPANAAFMLGSEPGVVGSVVVPVRGVLLDVLLLGVAVSMFGRWRAASTIRRRMLWPVALVGTATVASHMVFQAARQTDFADSLGAVTAVCVVAVAATFLFALVGRRLLLAEILMRLNGTARCRAQLRDELADALEDPEIEVLARADVSGPWRDGAGHELTAPPEPAPGRDVTVIEGDADGPALALVHAAALRDDEELVTAVGSLVLARWSNEEIAADRDRALADLVDARRRIDEAAEAERARIGRDLHDGVQQRLIALGIRLALAEKTLHDDPVAGARAVRGFTLEVDEALEELRSYASGTFPRVLHEHGLEGALRALARDTPLPVHVNVSGLTRHELDTETSLYFVCAEAVQNAMKYAKATGVWIEIAQDRHVRFEIRDDGVGFVLGRSGTGHGLRNIRDRVHSAGGEVVIHTSPGCGTRITGTIYVQRRAASAASPRPVPASGVAPRTNVIVYERLLPAVPATVSQTRRELDEGLRSHGVDGAERADIALLLSEATTNVVRHAYPDGRPGPLYVVAALHGETLNLSVIDHGAGIPARTDDVAEGLGLRLMRRLADDLDVVSGTPARGTAVHATFDHVTPSADAAPPTTVTTIARGQLLHDYARVLAAIHPDLRDDARAALLEAQHTLTDSRGRWPAGERTA